MFKVKYMLHLEAKSCSTFTSSWDALATRCGQIITHVTEVGADRVITGPETEQTALITLSDPESLPLLCTFHRTEPGFWTEGSL